MKDSCARSLLVSEQLFSIFSTAVQYLYHSCSAAAALVPLCLLSPASVGVAPLSCLEQLLLGIPPLYRHRVVSPSRGRQCDNKRD